MELIGCQIADLKLILSLHAKLCNEERRRSPRQPAAGRVQLVIHRSSRRLLVRGEMKDKSHHGLGLLALLPCQVGDKVEVLRGEAKHIAVVRHCRRQGASYLVGLEFVAA